MSYTFKEVSPVPALDQPSSHRNILHGYINPFWGFSWGGGSEYNSPSGMERQTLSISLPIELLLFCLGHPVRGVSVREQVVGQYSILRSIVPFSCIVYFGTEKGFKNVFSVTLVGGYLFSFHCCCTLYFLIIQYKGVQYVVSEFQWHLGKIRFQAWQRIVGHTLSTALHFLIPICGVSESLDHRGKSFGC